MASRPAVVAAGTPEVSQLDSARWPSRPAVVWPSYLPGGAATMSEHRRPSRAAWLTRLRPKELLQARWLPRIRPKELLQARWLARLRLDELFRAPFLTRMSPERRLAFGAACLATLLLAAWGGWQVFQSESGQFMPAASAGAQGSPTALSPTSTKTLPALDRSVPMTISIESIQLQAKVDQIGLGANGAIAEPPFSKANDAFWYRLGPTPGQVGPAVIVGHVDTKTSLAVFFYLRRLRAGDHVVVNRADGRSVTFAVDRISTYPKSDFPTKLVYGPTDYAALRLITCGGPFDSSVGSYRDNVVVFAHMTAHT